MGGDDRTIEWYTSEAPAYADCNAGEADHPALARFAAMLPAGSEVLDFGCGPGWAAGRLIGLGSYQDSGMIKAWTTDQTKAAVGEVS